MSGVDLDHPEVIFIKRLDGTGYGFFYSTPAQFDNAAYGFIGPIKERIKKESEEKNELPVNAEELCLKASITSMEKVFEPNWEDNDGIDGARCVAASCVAESKWEGEMPQCIVIEQTGDDITLREGFEFLEHPGYPLCVVIGSKGDGGGLCTFFDTEDEFRLVATKVPSEHTWLPQLIYRLYAKTPSIMTGFPTPSPEGKGISVECHAYTLNRQGHLIERQRKA
ncbi:hypothetical protein MTBPR1_10040 [Candidatus Terasakiella magnetica]|uniref:Uncharacterized protein n=1 Tax=Candidatus Terasakiella magnetica TaxID=1867952 RepID=A0A1C3RBY6_9PROT|nr:hypothetical protein [Candidatus Terasakiella magnetica]SCA54793.1 hypothetical protein MTBPR1_10040 [Candidatus Terasakiella magnetica]